MERDEAQMGKFIVQIGRDDQYWFDLKAVNGEIIGRSEQYTTREHCLHGIESVKKNANSHTEDQCEADHPHYQLPKYEIFKSDKDAQFYFHLRAGNGEIILASEGYTAKESAIKGILSVGANAPDAPIEEITK